MYQTLKLPDLLFAGLLILYGLVYWFAPPKFEGKNAIRTRNLLQSPEAWFYGHKTAGKMFLITGVMLAVLCYLRFHLIGMYCSAFFRYGHTALELGLFAFELTLTNRMVEKKFGKGPAPDYSKDAAKKKKKKK